MKKLFIRLFLIPYMIGFLASCGGGNGNGSNGSDASDPNSVVSNQNKLMSEAAAKFLEVLTGFDSFHVQQQAINTYDENTGQDWLDYYNNTFIPQTEEMEEKFQQLADEEQKLANLVSQQQALVFDPGVKFVEPLTIYVSGALIFAAVVTTWALFAARTVPQVKRVEDKVQEGLDKGLSPAQAFNEASSTYKDAQDNVFLDLQLTNAANAFFSALGNVPGHCHKIGVSLLNIGSEALNEANLKLFGKKKKAANGNLKFGLLQDDSIYLGESDNGIFENIPLGEWDFFFFKDGFVRGNANDISLQSCAAPTNLNVTMLTTDDLFGGASGGGGPFEIVTFFNRDGTQGTDPSQAELQVGGGTSFPSFSWIGGGAVAFVVVDQVGNHIYAIGAVDDEDGNILSFNSPLTYGNYSVSNSEPLNTAQIPSPALQSGIIYTVQVAFLDGSSSSLVFIIP